MEDYFDWEYYVNNNEDLYKCGIDNFNLAWKHWLEHGRREGRHCLKIQEDFDWRYYTRTYNDMNCPNEIIAYEHYLNHGKREGREINDYKERRRLEEEERRRLEEEERRRLEEEERRRLEEEERRRLEEEERRCLEEECKRSEELKNALIEEARARIRAEEARIKDEEFKLNELINKRKLLEERRVEEEARRRAEEEARRRAEEEARRRAEEEARRRAEEEARRRAGEEARRRAEEEARRRAEEEARRRAEEEARRRAEEEARRRAEEEARRRAEEEARRRAEEEAKSVSIIIGYKPDKTNLIAFLNDFSNKYNKYKHEIIILYGISHHDDQLSKDQICKFGLNIKCIKCDEQYMNLVYNIGISNSKYENLIIHDSNCKYNQDIIESTLINLTDRNYCNFSCNKTFCISVKKSNISLIYFDKRFTKSHYFENIILSLKYNLRLDIINYNNSGYISSINNNKNYTESNENKELFENIKKIHERNDFVYPKLMFLYWDNSPLSYLNYLTVESFNEYNPEWKIVVYTPENKTNMISWKTHENKTKYTKRDYFSKLKYKENVIIKKIQFSELGFIDEASEVIKSDYLRYFMLEKHGGIWSDFDIIFTDSIEKCLNYKENNIIYHCTGYDNVNGVNHPFSYYPIGFFTCKPNSQFFKYIKDQCNKHYNKDIYQCIGANMFNGLFKSYQDVYKIDSTKILDNNYYLPWQCNEIPKFINNLDNILPINNFGIHWFNGGTLSKQYSIDLEDRIRNNFKINNYLDKFVMKYLKRNNICLICESSYPGGGGEEFMYDLSVFLTEQNYNVFWINYHDWGKPFHNKYIVNYNKYYTEIRLNNRKIESLDNYDVLNQILKNYHINYILHQGSGHKLVCDLGNKLNIPTITFWCFWEEMLNIDWNIGLIDIQKNLNAHNINKDFKYIVDNIDHFYFASDFVKKIAEEKYKLIFNDDNVFNTLSIGKRIIKNSEIDSFESIYITLLDCHTLKGGELLSKLIIKNPTVNFLAVKTEDEEGGPNLIKKAFLKVNNKNNMLIGRVNNVSELYNKTKILLCPTRLDETFCRVVYEAFRNKIPVIFSKCGNLGTINNNLLCMESEDVNLYTIEIHKLINDRQYYNNIITKQYKYYNDVMQKYSYSKIERRLVEIENRKNKRIGIFTPWCDQGLGIQSRIYKHLLENMGYEIFIFSTKPYVHTNKNSLLSDKNEWEVNNIYRSPNRRLEIRFLELDKFVSNYKIRKMIIPEIQYDLIFKMANYLKNEYNISSYAIPNVECIRNIELNKFDVFEKVLTNNKMTYNILKDRGIKNTNFIGFHYTIPPQIKINEINKDKRVDETIQILHLSGLNGIFRKRTDKIVNIFEKLHKDGIKFKLNICIQGNFDKKVYNIFNKPFINLIYDHITYSDILNIYNKNHISIQFSKHEGLGLGFYESCYMNTPVMTLDAPPHNEVISHKNNGWLLSCTLKEDEKQENPYSIIKQTQIDENILYNEIKEILKNKDEINRIIENTKSFTEKNHSLEKFSDNIKLNLNM